MSHESGETPNQHNLSQKANDKHGNRRRADESKDKNYKT